MHQFARAFALSAFMLGTALPLFAQGTYKQTVPLDPVNIDRSANACTDFYQFANGGWLKSNPIPAAFSSWGSFNELNEQNNDALTRILKKAAVSTDARQATTKMLGT